MSVIFNNFTYKGIDTSIVRNGLIAHWDAGNSSSYPGSGTTWTDVSGSGYTGTIAAGTTYSSGPPASFTFNGTTSASVLTNVNTTVTSATFLCWIKRTAAQTRYTGIMFNRSTNVLGLSFDNGGTGLTYTWNNSSGTYNFNSGTTLTLNVWCQVAVSVSPTSATFYLNDTQKNTNTFTHGSQTVNALYIGLDNIGLGRNMNGNIAISMMYNRALSASEVTQNFNALRDRYGI